MSASTISGSVPSPFAASYRGTGSHYTSMALPVVRLYCQHNGLSVQLRSDQSGFVITGPATKVQAAQAALATALHAASKSYNAWRRLNQGYRKNARAHYGVSGRTLASTDGRVTAVQAGISTFYSPNLVKPVKSVAPAAKPVRQRARKAS